MLHSPHRSCCPWHCEWPVWPPPHSGCSSVPMKEHIVDISQVWSGCALWLNTSLRNQQLGPQRLSVHSQSALSSLPSRVPQGTYIHVIYYKTFKTISTISIYIVYYKKSTLNTIFKQYIFPHIPGCCPVSSLPCSWGSHRIAGWPVSGSLWPSPRHLCPPDSGPQSATSALCWTRWWSQYSPHLQRHVENVIPLVRHI